MSGAVRAKAPRVEITRCEPLEVGGRRYPGWSVLDVRDYGWADEEVIASALSEIVEGAALIAAAHLPCPADPDDPGIGISWSSTFIGPLPDALADLVAKAMVVRLRETVPQARRRWLDEYRRAGR